jgi:hypothetical protein
MAEYDLKKRGVASSNQNINCTLVQNFKDIFCILQGKEGMIESRTGIEDEQGSRVDGTASYMRR